MQRPAYYYNLTIPKTFLVVWFFPGWHNTLHKWDFFCNGNGVMRRGQPDDTLFWVMQRRLTPNVTVACSSLHILPALHELLGDVNVMCLLVCFYSISHMSSEPIGTPYMSQRSLSHGKLIEFHKISKVVVENPLPCIWGSSTK